ncbi:MAG: sensor histidine kinase [Candidatus Hodarchaeota archaeon]
MKKLSEIFDIPPTDPEAALRQKLLRVMVLTVCIGMIGALLLDLMTNATLYHQILLLLMVNAAIFFVNQRGYAELASILFILFLMVSSFALSLIDPEMCLLYIVPIVIASVLLPPWTGFLIAVISSFILVSPVSVSTLPPGPIIVVFVVVSLVGWITSRGFAQTRKELMILNLDLEKRVEERTGELRVAQEELLLKEKLAMLGQLSGGIGHELRSPLSAIKNSTELLKLRLESEDPEILELIEAIKKEVEKSVNVIESLLGFAQPRDPIKVSINPNDTINNLLSYIQFPKNIEFIQNLASGLPEIRVDPFQLKQALNNLVLNAIQAMPDGGTLTLSTFIKDKEWVCISVEDTGHGISADDFKRIFQPLFTTKTMGVGLGLSISRMFIEANNGVIDVESAEGQGSTFCIRFPV